MLRKKLLFWLTWLCLVPFVLLYYVFMAITSGNWRSIFLKTSLVYQSVWENLVIDKPAARQAYQYNRKKRRY